MSGVKYFNSRKKAIVASCIAGSALLAAGGFAVVPQFAKLTSGAYMMPGKTPFEQSAIGLRELGQSSWVDKLPLFGPGHGPGESATVLPVGNNQVVQAESFEASSRERGKMTNQGKIDFQKFKVSLHSTGENTDVAEYLRLQLYPLGAEGSPFFNKTFKEILDSGDGIEINRPIPKAGASMTARVVTSNVTDGLGGRKLDALEFHLTPVDVPAPPA